MKKMARARAGVTLVELAIVLAVAGAILAGVWATIRTSRDAALITQAENQHLALLSNVRNFYRARQFTRSGVLNVELIRGGVIPAEMVRAGTVNLLNHAWGVARPNGNTMPVVPAGLLNWPQLGRTSVAVYGSDGGEVIDITTNCAPTPRCNHLVFHYRGLPPQACTRLALALSQNNAATGLTAVQINNIAPRLTVNDPDPLRRVPVVNETAFNLCARGTFDASGPINQFDESGADITLTYRLRAPTN